jgi:hypothetical protein
MKDRWTEITAHQDEITVLREATLCLHQTETSIGELVHPFEDTVRHAEIVVHHVETMALH